MEESNKPTGAEYAESVPKVLERQAEDEVDGRTT